MENLKISKYSELTFRIMQLKSEKLSQEIEIKHSIKEFMYTFKPLSMVKDSLRSFSKDEDVKFDLAKIGLNVGANFIIDKVLGRNRSIKGFLSSMLFEKISSTFINNNASGIISNINKLIRPK